MIKKLEIENFKSMKHLSLDCKRVNVFIGEPNAGKSNILEALGLLSHASHGNIWGFVRLETMTDLFYNKILDANVDIGFDEKALEIKFKDGIFRGAYFDGKSHHHVFDYGFTGPGSFGGSGNLP